jgi:hypothetical protein
MALQPVEGGGGIAGSYQIISQRPDLLVVGTNTVQDAVTVTARDKIYGVTFSFTRSTKSWEGGAVQAAASFYAGAIQGLAAHPHVLGMTYTQDVNQSGNLIDSMEITVGTDDGEQAASFVWPLETLDGLGVYSKADAVYANLVAVAESGQ